MTEDIAAALERLDQEKAEAERLEPIARLGCNRCRKRFAQPGVYDPDGKPLCAICVPRRAREILRAAKLERRRQAMLFPPTMAVPQGRMRRRGR